MLLPDSIYRRIPALWMVMGVMFITIALLSGREFHMFPAFLLLGAVSVARSIALYSARQRVVRNGEVSVLTETRKIDKNSME